MASHGVCIKLFLMRIFGWIIGFMSNVTSTILTESGTNELEIIEFHLEKKHCQMAAQKLVITVLTLRKYEK